MKPDLHLIRSFILMTLFCVLSIASYSQVQEFISADSTSQEIEISAGESEEKAHRILLNIEKDSVTARTNTPKSKLNIEPTKSEKLKEESDEEDSILSFNFIYYIIRKFKLSDIIDH
jgi:hypothetical protein